MIPREMVPRDVSCLQSREPRKLVAGDTIDPLINFVSY